MSNFDFSYALLAVSKLIMFVIVLSIIASLVRSIAKYLRCLYQKPKATLKTSIAMVLCCFFLYKLFGYILDQKEKEYQLGYVPTELGIQKVIYGNEESWGFGPGGNETGLIVYELPEKAVDSFMKKGINYLSEIYPNLSQSNHFKWEKTPISPNWNWNINSEYYNINPSPKIHISDYLGTFGNYIDVDSDIEHTIDEIISIPSSYYIYTESGVVIIAPMKKMLIYAYYSAERHY